MTIRTSGPLTMAEIKAELSSTSNRLGDYFTQAGMGPPYSMSRFYGYSSGFRFSLALSTSVSAFDLRAWLLTAGWNGVQQVGGTLTINPGVIVSNGLRIADLPAGSTVDLVVYGTIAGIGGAGGRGSNSDVENGVPGGAGGHGLYLRNAVRLRDLAGSIIAGGGGGGGGGASGAGFISEGLIATGAGGGGGGGQSGSPIVSAAGAGGTAHGAPPTYAPQNGAAGASGTHAGPGVGGAGGWGGSYTLGGVGGTGGTWGQPGASGENGGRSPDGSYQHRGSPGGPAGLAVDGWAYVQHIEHSGTFYGGLG